MLWLFLNAMAAMALFVSSGPFRIVIRKSWPILDNPIDTKRL